MAVYGLPSRNISEYSSNATGEHKVDRHCPAQILRHALDSANGAVRTIIKANEDLMMPSIGNDLTRRISSNRTITLGTGNLLVCGVSFSLVPTLGHPTHEFDF